MLAGKIGAYTTAELGSMNVTEQMDAVRCLGADPIEEFILPRFLGIIVASFFLLSVGVLTSIAGGLLTADLFADINPPEYLRNVAHILTFTSVFGGVFKCFIFAFTLATVCTFKGYHASGGARGVGRAVVQTAVVTMIGIVVTDWLTTNLMDSAILFLEKLFR
jgi:phospholipid/cholesterol/gamma-HCH transport system permease protein